MNPNPHRARITHNGKRLNLGSYPTKHDAQTAQTAATNLLKQLTPQDTNPPPPPPPPTPPPHPPHPPTHLNTLSLHDALPISPKPQTPDAKTLITYITQGRYDHATQAIHQHITNRHNLITKMRTTRKFIDSLGLNETTTQNTNHPTPK